MNENVIIGIVLLGCPMNLDTKIRLAHFDRTSGADHSMSVSFYQHAQNPYYPDNGQQTDFQVSSTQLIMVPQLGVGALRSPQ